MEALLFWTFAVVTVAMAVVVIASRKPVACALALATAFFGLAALFVTLEAFFLAIVQIIVYAGVVMTLFIFIIMLLDAKEEEKRKFPWKRVASVGVLIILFGIFFSGVLASLLHIHEPLVWQDQVMGENIRQVGKLLFSGYMLPFLTTGVLLLLATMGVVLLNRKDSQ